MHISCAFVIILFILSSNVKECKGIRCVWEIIHDAFLERDTASEISIVANITSRCGDKRRAVLEWAILRHFVRNPKFNSPVSMAPDEDVVSEESQRYTGLNSVYGMKDTNSNPEKTTSEFRHSVVDEVTERVNVEPDFKSLVEAAKQETRDMNLAQWVMEEDEEDKRPATWSFKTGVACGMIVGAIVILLTEAFCWYKEACQVTQTILEGVQLVEAEVLDINAQIEGTNKDFHSKEAILERIQNVANEIRSDSNVSQESKDTLTPEFLDEMATFILDDWTLNSDLRYLTPKLLLNLATHFGGSGDSSFTQEYSTQENGMGVDVRISISQWDKCEEKDIGTSFDNQEDSATIANAPQAPEMDATKED